MALSLSAPLLAAQTSESRRPIMTMSSGRLSFDFPLIGKSFDNTEEDNEDCSFGLFLNDGRLGVFFTIDGGDGTDYLRYVYTDDEVTYFSDYVNVESSIESSYEYIDGIVDTDTGNIFLAAQYGANYLRMYRISPYGVKLGSTEIGITGLLGVSVVETETGYIAIYIRLDTGSYSFNLITSSDFITWSAPTVLSIFGDIPGDDVFDDTYPVKHPKLFKLEDDTYILFFSYASILIGDSVLYNIAYSTTIDLSTFEDFLPVTTNTDIYKDYVYPDVQQRNDGSLFVVIEEDNTYLTMDNSTFGWYGNSNFQPTNMYVDDINGKLYVTAINYQAGSGYLLSAFVQIDIATWTIDKMYNDITTPPVPPFFFSGSLAGPPDKCLNATELCCSFIEGTLGICVADFSTDTIRGFYLDDYSVEWGSSAAQNVNHDLYSDDYWNSWGTWTIRNLAIIDNKLYIALENGHIFASNQFLVGYIDLSDGTPPYDFVVIGAYGGGGDPVSSKLYQTKAKFYPNDEIIIVTSAFYPVGGSLPVQFITMSMVDGAVLSFEQTTYINFPYKGFSEAVYIDGIVYAIAVYDSTIYDERNKWGLCELDTADGHTEYHYPPWETSPGNTMWDMVVNEATYEIMIRTTHGASIFNYVSKTWARVDNESLNEMPPDTNDRGIAYSLTYDVFFYGGSNSIYYVPRNGVIQKVKYSLGTFGVSTWEFASLELLALGNSNQNPCVIRRSDGLLYFTWTNVSGSYDTIYWDRQEAFISLDDYIVGEIMTHFNVEGDPNKLKFTVSHGHLFDPHNDNSLLRPFVEKGKQIQLQYGERINDINYWAYQGMFTITTQEVSYENGVYPVMEITAEDIRSLWALNQVPVANITLRSPEDALIDIITAETEIAAEDIDIPTMALSFEFDAQWIDAYLQDIIDDISHRFQHFCIIDMQGNVEFRPFNFDSSSDNNHYPAQIRRFLIDSTYSDLTNRYTVTGQSQYDFQTLFAEERVGSLNGTVGWYGYKKDFQIWYSEDKSRRCQYPRLEVLESSTSILFKLAGAIEEELLDVDPDMKYCIIEVRAPNLIPFLIAGIAIFLVGMVIGDKTTMPYTTPYGRIIEGLGTYMISMTLGSIGNFQYAIHAQPVGYLKREYIVSANDLELQQESHQITEQKIEGFICYNTDHCQDVADFELEIARAQRSRVKVEKITHLQDEAGDIISIIHPYTQRVKKMFIADLTRRFKASVGKDNGYFLDEIEGWII